MIYDHCLPVRLTAWTGNRAAWFKLTHYPSFTMLGAGNAVFVRLIRVGSLLIKRTSPKMPVGAASPFDQRCE